MGDLELVKLSKPRPAWFDDARCVELGLDVDLFFPTRGEDVRAAQEVCAGCRVRRTCLAYALEHGEHYGIWGGESERARRRMRRHRGLFIERKEP